MLKLVAFICILAPDLCIGNLTTLTNQRTCYWNGVLIADRQFHLAKPPAQFHGTEHYPTDSRHGSQQEMCCDIADR